MHVVLAASRISSQFSYGGIARVLADRSKQLVKLGHRVTIIGAFDNPDEVPPCEGVKLINVPFKKLLPWRVPLVNFLVHGVMIGKEIQKIDRSCKVDVVDVHEPDLSIGIYGVAKKLGIATVHTIHVSVLNGPRRYSTCLYRALRAVNLYAARRSNLTIAVSDFIRRRYIESGCAENQLVTVRNPIELNVGTILRPFEETFTNVLWLGRMVNGKGLSLAVEASLLCCKHSDRLRFFFVGDGDLKVSCESLVPVDLRSRIRFLGHIASTDRLSQIRKECDIFLFTSEFETAPLVIGEAMASSMAIVSYPLPAVKEMIGDSHLFLKQRSKDEICHHILQVHNDRSLLISLAEKARQRAVELFEPRTLACTLEKAYLQAISKVQQT